MTVLVAASLVHPALAWTAPELKNVFNSAPGPGIDVIIHADVSGPVDNLTAKLFYSTDDQNTWQEVAMTPINEPGFDSTFQASFTAPDSGRVHYYVRADDPTNFATLLPFFEEDHWRMRSPSPASGGTMCKQGRRV